MTWKRYEQVHPLTIGLYPFAPDTRIGVDFNQRMNEWSLIIQDIRPTDEGVYQCQISTKNDHESYNIMLRVRCMYCIHNLTAASVTTLTPRGTFPGSFPGSLR